MKRFARNEIATFLGAVDRHAPKNSKVVIIGGAAATLSFGVTGGTIDIDTANRVTALQKAGEAAREATGLRIPMERATVFDAPRDYERRLKRLPLKGLRRLAVFVPEKHDWALMKIVRFEDKDLAHLKAASSAVGFELRIFEERFLSEMTHVLPRERLVTRFLAMIEELYGEPEASRLEAAIKKRRFWR
jgi:hypothetical protein